MTPERWREIEAIYQSVMDRDPALRDAFLSEACRGDEELRREVESLLKLNGLPVLIDQPAWQAAGELLDNDSIVAAGTQLGPYRIEGILGAGGMGQVYRARDTRLDRLVAIKVSKEEFNERFGREARAVAALNHPNICSLYDVGPNYLVMELVEGPTLAERIKRGQIPLEEALRIARQIGDALQSAHERGIVHRDLKPGNIKITPEGVVKVLDFGLAKRRAVETALDVKPEDSPTLSIAMTSAGVILGTAAYMSPEQARGKTVDKRADIWAFGVVVYEMLTGRQLFAGATVTDTLVAVMTNEPDWQPVPAKSRRLLRRCLDKDPNRRLRDIGDAWDLLEDTPTEDGVRSKRLPWVVAAVAAAVAVFASGYGWLASRASERPLLPLMRLDVDLGPDVALNSTGGPAVLLSPDGTRLAYVSRRRLYVRRLDQPNVTELAGTEGAYNPFFSPDGQWLAFFAHGQLKKVQVEGSSVISLCDATVGPLVSGAWGEDGTILTNLSFPFALFRLPSAGGSPAPITPLPENGALLWPQWLPGANAVLFSPNANAVSPQQANILTLSEMKWKSILPVNGHVRYVPTGHLVYLSRGNLMALPFDLDRLAPRGAPVMVLQGVGWRIIGGAGEFDFSRNGTLVYQPIDPEANLTSVQWLEAGGDTHPALPKPASYFRPRLSPDGQRLAVAWGDDVQHLDISVHELSSHRETQLSFDHNTTGPIWTPDGRYILASRNRGGGMLWMRSDGANRAQVVFQNDRNRQFPFSFTSDQKRLAFMEAENDNSSKYHVWTVPVQTDANGLHFGKPEPFFHTTAADERHPAFSPDGRWLAYTSNETGMRHIWVRAFPGSPSSGRWQISKSGGSYPLWSRQGRRLFFRTEEDQVMVADWTTAGDSFVVDSLRAWSETLLGDIGPQSNFDIAPDGKRIIGILPAGRPRHHVVFLLNFFDDLRRRVPVVR